VDVENKQAIENKPDYPESFYNCANYLAKQGKYAESIELYQQAIEIKPDYAEAFYNWSLVLDSADQRPQAIEKCQQAIDILKKNIELNPNDKQLVKNYKIATALQSVLRT
jgi:tetratricopeptide (TPR) repeat protein